MASLPEHIHRSNLYSKDLAPIEPSSKTWNLWNLTAIWIGMAVCIPTYILATYMIRDGISWEMALLIIFAANLLITIPMVLNGHAGVKYGIPFPVLGRAAFGTKGIHIPSMLRALVACGWFGIQTWVGGLAVSSIWNSIAGSIDLDPLSLSKFGGFIVFWFINVYFIWKGTESIRWLEHYSAPILLGIGILLFVWGYNQAGSMSLVLNQNEQLQKASAQLTANENEIILKLNPLYDINSNAKAEEYQVSVPSLDVSKREYIPLGWIKTDPANLLMTIPDKAKGVDTKAIRDKKKPLLIQFRKKMENSEGEFILSSERKVFLFQEQNKALGIWNYVLWFSAMVGFWATMSISISDITRYAKSQRDQIIGQFVGLPGTMIFYSFIGIFVTAAAIIGFDDVLISEDTPWDPVNLVAKFNHPGIVIFAQIAMIIATLTTNLAANVIAPANAFSNLFPKRINFRMGGIITGIVGIATCPWWLMDEISGLLIFVSGLLGPVLAIMLCDYFILRKKTLNLESLFKEDGEYSYTSGYNLRAFIALVVGIVLSLIGHWINALSFLYNLSWFTGFIASFFLYWALNKNSKPIVHHEN